jgi:hypothetical protein
MLTDTLPLLDVNGLHVRTVSRAEAERLVAIGHCDPVIPGGWRERKDVPWTAVQLTVEQDYRWSTTALTSSDSMKAAGLIPTDEDSEAKLKFWCEIGDDRAIRVRRG